MKKIITLAALLTLSACNSQSNAPVNMSCVTSLHVLGNGQDAGKPQIGVHSDPAWSDPDLRALATSVAVVDQESGARYLIDATPDIKAQLYILDQQVGSTGFQLDGVFLTHAHIGHYLGLAQLGREAMGAKSIPVYAMPRMEAFLRNNGPWDQLVELNNIDLKSLKVDQPISLNGAIKIEPFLVPHRGEYSETVGYKIQGANKSAIFLPDIDSWEEFEQQGVQLSDVIKTADYIFIDGSFFSGDELPGRDMSKIPHPTITRTMDYLRELDATERKKVKFIHLNHSNPVHDEHTNAFEDIEKAGYSIAQMGEQYCLD
ncbi:MAG: MBL fold metallo-hydrolase [Hyphomonadaceae bacterium]|nr:MBL fold metallo-hydrolase [Hyphomonadaceae bacterium]